MIKIQRKKNVWIKERGKIVKNMFLKLLMDFRDNKIAQVLLQLRKKWSFTGIADDSTIPAVKRLSLIKSIE